MCDRCHQNPATVVVVDVPDALPIIPVDEDTVLRPDQVLTRELCPLCLLTTEADGPWDAVHPIAMEAAA